MYTQLMEALRPEEISHEGAASNALQSVEDRHPLNVRKVFYFNER